MPGLNEIVSPAVNTYDDVASKGRTGFYWLTAGRVSTFIVRLGTSIIMARILFPHDYGLMSMAVAFAGMASAFGDFGIGAALIQKHGAEGDFLDASFVLTVAAGLLIGIVQYLLAPLGVIFYGVPEVGQIMRVLAFTYPVTSLFSVHSAYLQKNLSFHWISIIEFSSHFFTSLGMILFALMGYGVWSFVFPPLLVKCASVPAYWIASRYIPRISFKKVKRHAREIIQFGKFATGNSILNYIVKNADYLLIGKLLNPSSLGLYTFAYENSRLVSRFILNLMTKVSFPAFAALKENKTQMLKAYLKLLQVLTFFSFPIIIFGMIHAGPIIQTLYGDRWLQAIVPFQIICIYALINSFTSTSGSFLYAIGRPDVNFKIALSMIPFLFTAMYLGVKFYGIVGCAAAIALVQSIFSLFKIYMNFRIAEWNFVSLWHAIKLNLLFSIIAVGFSWFVHIPFHSLPGIPKLFLLTALSSTFYLLLKVQFDRRGMETCWAVILTPGLNRFVEKHVPSRLRTGLCLSPREEHA